MSDIGWSERRMRDERGVPRRTGQIEIRDLEVFAYHGVYESEQERGQRFRLDIVLDADMHIPAQTDHLSDAIDYARVVSDVADLVRSTRYHLLEALATRVVDHLLGIPRVAAAAVRVTKPDVQLREQVGQVAVTVRRARPMHL
ncbi:MAG TPA: dihydroneopterin aldolase [Euzebyales bacterium]|nr:dihydroneopterin aldolase [Euzebyales bacterium]